jgi:hypothetical protein
VAVAEFHYRPILLPYVLAAHADGAATVAWWAPLSFGKVYYE